MIPFFFRFGCYGSLCFCCLGIASAGQGVGAHKWVCAQSRRSSTVLDYLSPIAAIDPVVHASAAFKRHPLTRSVPGRGWNIGSE